MTSEYCSKQLNIYREQKRLHKGKKITAFVIMNFSDMSDVVYKWRLKPFIESLTKYLYFDKNFENLYCSSVEIKDNIPKDQKVKEIQVVRADSDPASNYVICSRICQQMQIADLVVVDVSSKNANVFYEFGMAVAFGKLILPICYSESFYKMVVPGNINNNWDLFEKVEHHMGCYPWRKDLFEYYGILYKNKESKTQYLEYNQATDVKYGFSDVEYARFPYHEYINGDSETIGVKIYNRLAKVYNTARPRNNTLVVYTIDAFLNEDQAGQCIVNFYNVITASMSQYNCFCGERVGVLVQENVISECEKDGKSQLDLDYNVGEIIQIGLNQATYLSMKEKINAGDCFTEIVVDAIERNDIPSDTQEQIERSVKEYVTNKAMRIHPNKPVFVDRLKNLFHDDILDKLNEVKTCSKVCECYNTDFFCLYHIMLRTLRYTNEIVVDISNNCIQSLFWLGTAHGLDVHAIAVMHRKDDEEKESRFIFDVAGLWTAILKKDDIEGFYQQLALAQSGIERSSKLILRNNEYYKNQINDHFFSSNKDVDIEKIESNKKNDETTTLESYYRTHFWTPMLSYNQLSIYISQRNELDQNNEPKICTAKWDFDAISELSNYLSKRKIIGEYKLISLEDNDDESKKKDDNKKLESIKKVNFISVGSFAQPLEPGMEQYIYDQLSSKKDETLDKYGVDFNLIHKRVEERIFNEECEYIFKGFSCIGNKEKGYFSHVPLIKKCSGCQKKKNGKPSIFFDLNEAQKSNCALENNGEHYEVAQLILWRDEEGKDNYGHYWVAIVGCSGPATLALSTILTDTEPWKDKGDDNNKYNFLYELQYEVRKKFMKVYLTNLYESIYKLFNNKNISEEQIKKFFCKIKYAVSFYLQTVLYRYFLPFLNENDVIRIKNGMYTFANTMRVNSISPFIINKEFEEKSMDYDKVQKEVVKKVSEELANTLRSFKGLESFYQVRVQHNLKEKNVRVDTRKIISIEPLKKNESQVINCFLL